MFSICALYNILPLIVVCQVRLFNIYHWKTRLGCSWVALNLKLKIELDGLSSRKQSTPATSFLPCSMPIKPPIFTSRRNLDWKLCSSSSKLHIHRALYGCQATGNFHLAMFTLSRLTVVSQHSTATGVQHLLLTLQFKVPSTR